jgi:hypothetical protein
MTAIFVYADSDIAFVASDTKREVCGFTTVACKTMRWSENILISQTGFGEGLQRLVGEMLAWQHRHPMMLTGAGVEHAFKQLAAGRLKAEVAMLKHSYNAKNIGGSLVVAEAPRGGSPGAILTLDWASEGVETQPGPVYADGTDQPAFLRIATTRFASMRRAAGTFDLAAWGLTCISDAIAHLGGASVDWPADLAICRLDRGMPITLIQRVTGPAGPTHPLFVI